MDIVSWTLDRVREHEKEPLYIDANDPTRYHSRSGVRAFVRQLVSGFHHHGLNKGDCVCVVSLNDINYTPLYLGIIGAGGCFTGANPGYTTRELVHHLSMTGARFILTELRTLRTSINAARECGIPVANIFILNFKSESIPVEYTSVKPWSCLLDHKEKDWVQVGDPDTPAVYASTSGTTGLPKAAIISHSYLTSQGKIVEDLAAAEGKVSYLIPIPAFHAFAIPIQHALPIRTGQPIYILPRFEESSFINALTRFNITNTVAVPPILLALTKYSTKELRTLMKIFVGGSPLPLGVEEQLYQSLSQKARIVQVYGMTEVGWAVSWMKKQRNMTGSIGQALPGIKLRIVDVNGDAVFKDRCIGEIQIYSMSAMKSYLNNPQATNKAFTPDRWVRTGDIGYVKDNDWYVIDRAKDLIKVRGFQVSPAEIEATLIEHSDITDAGVIAIPASDGCGESPMAFIVLKEGKQLEKKHIQTFLATQLARYKNVEEVEFVDKIPRNPTGKILRRVLRDMRGCVPSTPDQIVAKEYAAALKQLDLDERLRKESLTSSSLPECSVEKQVSVETLDSNSRVLLLNLGSSGFKGYRHFGVSNDRILGSLRDVSVVEIYN
ncbi:hypothetical protein BGZ60DRAFT_524048 [Tricladium varicosporioides]|nr:hypothetical protein BGZ60DRAFT_524048 [Hymenoscyphus varicosporioides]